MKESDSRNLKDLRRKHNADLIRRMRSGDALKTVDSRSSWFPPRPIIKKDPLAIQKLYSSPAPKRSSDGEGSNQN